MAGPHPGGFLSVMDRRSDLLRLLGARALTKPELEDELDVSRSTIDRGLRDLEAKALVERTPDGYRQSLCGRLALSEYDRFTGRIEGLCESSELLEGLDRETDISPTMLEGAEVVSADRTEPHRPLEVLYGLVDRAESVQGFAPAVHPQQVETYRRRVTDHGMTADLVVTADVVERLVASYADDFEAVVDTAAVRFRQTDKQLPYSLTVAETDTSAVAAVMVYASEGIRGCIHNDAPEAVTWARKRFDDVAATATPIGASTTTDQP